MTAVRVAALVAAMNFGGLVSFPQSIQTSAKPTTEFSSDVPLSCPITKPPVHPFVPPKPYSDIEVSNGFWFGTPALWTALPGDGKWNHLPHYTSDDPTFRQKLFWWRQSYEWHTQGKPSLRVTGRRLDGAARPLSSDQANLGWQRKTQPFMVVGINIPTLGCWEITGHYRDSDLSFVVWLGE
jgi:hypothetical protein